MASRASASRWPASLLPPPLVPSPTATPGVEQRRRLGATPQPIGRSQPGGVGDARPGRGHPGDARPAVISHRWASGDVGGQPAPLVEQLERAAAVALGGDRRRRPARWPGCAAAGRAARPPRRAARTSRAVAVHAGRPDRDLHERRRRRRSAVAIASAEARRGLRVVTGGAADEHQPGARARRPRAAAARGDADAVAGRPARSGGGRRRW